MGTVTETEFKKLSEAVADDLIKNNIPLNDSIRKVAKTHDLNQEQVSRLCEATNNVTFNKMFQARDKTAEDRIIDFDIANPKDILQGEIKEASHYNPAADAPIDLAEYRSLRPEYDFEKHAGEAIANTILDVESKKIRPEQGMRALSKTHAYLKHEKIAAEQLYDDAVINVRNQFRRLYGPIDFPTFEKHAAALHGPLAEKPLSTLRKMMRLPEVVYDYGKLTKTAGLIDDSHIIYKQFSNAVDNAQKIDLLERGIARLGDLIK